MRSVFRPFMVLAVLIFFCAVFPAGAETFFSRISWSFRGTILFFPEDDDLQSDPMPVLFSPGVAAAYPLVGPLWLEASYDFYFTHYGYNYDLGRAVPYAEENRSTLVFGSVLGIQALTRFHLGRKMDARLYGGFAADLRLCLIAEDLKGDDREDAGEQTEDVTNYFWGQGRWFYPVMGAGMSFAVTPRVMVGLDTRVWFPFYKAWTKEELPMAEGWRFGVGFIVTFK